MLCSASPVSRWIWSGPKEIEPPSVMAIWVCAPPMRGLDSVSAPRTTRTAPDEMSWSCQPVSFPGDQQMSQTSTYSSRWIEAKCRRPPAWETWSRHRSGRPARLSTRSASSCWPRYRAGSDEMVIAVTPLLLVGQIPGRRGQLAAVGQLVAPEEAGRVGHADGLAGGAAEAEIGVWLRIRAVRAEHEHVDAEHAQDGVDGAAAVAGGLDEHERIDHAPGQRAVPAAGGHALAVQRPETGQRGEADPQPRVGRPAVGTEREPGRVQLLNVGDQGRPPRRATRAHPGRGARVNEQREVPLGEHI